jgi:hypothetical protein
MDFRANAVSKTKQAISPEVCCPPNRCHPRQDAPMPLPPSATYERLRDYIAKSMLMSPIDHPLMLLELLGH